MLFPLRLCAVGLLLVVGSATAQPACRPGGYAQSGPRTAAIVELFTSEGCDSCPPADRWLSSLKPAADGPIPLAFHVDYWDYIGWKDPFAQAAFASRQRDAVSRQRGQVAYTPQILVDGADASIWASPARVEVALAKAAARPPRARLSVRAESAGEVLNIELGIQPAGLIAPDVVAFVAVTESRLESSVVAGENRGRTLRHDHVVRELSGPITLAPIPPGVREMVVRKSIVMPRAWKRQDLAVSAFLQDTRSGEFLQAVRLPACGDAG